MLAPCSMLVTFLLIYDAKAWCLPLEEKQAEDCLWPAPAGGWGTSHTRPGRCRDARPPASWRAQQRGMRVAPWHSYNHTVCRCGQTHPQMAHDERPTIPGTCLSDPQPLWFVFLPEDGLGNSKEPWLGEAPCPGGEVCHSASLPTFPPFWKIPVTVIRLCKDVRKMLGNYSWVTTASEKICIYVVLIICPCFTNLFNSHTFFFETATMLPSFSLILRGTDAQRG